LTLPQLFEYCLLAVCLLFDCYDCCSIVVRFLFDSRSIPTYRQGVDVTGPLEQLDRIYNWSENRPWSDRPHKPAELTDLGAEQQHSSEGQEQATVDLLTDTEEQLRAKVLASSAKYTVAGNCFPGHKPLTWTVDSLTVDNLHLGPGVMASIGTVTFVVIVIMIRLSALALKPYRYALVATWSVGQRVIGDVYWCEARVLHHVPDGTDLVGPEATDILRFYNLYLSGRDFPNWKVSKPFFRSGRQRYQLQPLGFNFASAQQY
jgi:hypothetical protein